MIERIRTFTLYLVATTSAVAALPLPDAQYYDDYPLPPPPGDPYGPIHDPYGPIYDPYGPRHDPYGPIVVDPYNYPPPPPHFDPYYDPYAPYPQYPHPAYPHHPPPPPPPPTNQDRKINREKEKKGGGVLDFDGEDARKAAESTRVVAAVMDEIADSGDTFDFLGEATFDKDKLIDGLNGASKLVRGFANIVDKGAGAMVSLKDRLGPRS